MFVKLKKPQWREHADESNNSKNIELPDIMNSNINRSPMMERKRLSFKMMNNDVLNIMSRDREEKGNRARESSEKIKRSIEQGKQSRAYTGSTITGSSYLTPIKVRSKVTGNFDSLHHRSLDQGARREREAEKDVEYIPKGFKHPEVKDLVLKPRSEEYNENVFDSLHTQIKDQLYFETGKYIYQKKTDQARAQTFCKILINGLYCAKFINKKECIFTPKKIIIPKTEVKSMSNTRIEKKE